MKVQKERKVVTAGLVPQDPVVSPVKQVVPGSLDDMMSGGEMPPEIVFVGAIKIREGSKAEDPAGGGYSVEIGARFGRGGIYDSLTGVFGNQDNALDALERQIGAMCQEVSEQGMDPVEDPVE